jgi:crossover junction endodeoxyribonuclease RusA
MEFIVLGTPVSFQRGSSRARQEWKDLVLATSMAKLPQNHFATEQRLAITLYYFPEDRRPGQPYQTDAGCDEQAYLR